MSSKRRLEHSLTAYDPSRTFDGYTLFSPRGGKDSWLIDMHGYVVKHWKLPYRPALYTVLLPNGNLIGAFEYKSRDDLGLPASFSGMGGFLMEIDWDSNIVWKCEVPYQSHEFHRLANGNSLYPCYPPDKRIPPDFLKKLKGGIPGTQSKEGLWADVIKEVTPAGKEVWEWVIWEHIDTEIDQMCPLEMMHEFPCINSVFGLPNGDVLASLRFMDTVAIIDKKTGDIKWRWGLKEIGHQHDASMLDNGNVLIFDNGSHRLGDQPVYSRIVEVNPATSKIEWEYKSDPPTDFWSAVMGGCQRLPNGNTLICESLTGRIFEVTLGCEIVWEYVSPFYAPAHHHGWINSMFRAYRYPFDYPGLKNRDLEPKRFDVVNRIYGPKAFKGALVK